MGKKSRSKRSRKIRSVAQLSAAEIKQFTDSGFDYGVIRGIIENKIRDAGLPATDADLDEQIRKVFSGHGLSVDPKTNKITFVKNHYRLGY